MSLTYKLFSFAFTVNLKEKLLNLLFFGFKVRVFKAKDFNFIVLETGKI